MEVHPTPVDNRHARKRHRAPDTWRRNRSKSQRYSSKTLPRKPTCTHGKKACFKCNSLTMTDLRHFHAAFYKNTEKNQQDAFILKYLKVSKTKRHRPRKADNNPTKKKNQATQFFIYSKFTKKLVRVCQKTFMDILGVKRTRIESIAKNFLRDGSLPKDRRGGDRRSHKYKDKRLAIIEFIKLLNCSEPHYCRGHTKRLYLPAELSINKLWKIYNGQAQPHLQVKKNLFSTVFNCNFNLGFGAPQTDVCSECLQYTEKIKIATRLGDERAKTKLMIEKRVHNERAKAFYKYLKDDLPRIAIFSFDCQKNLPLPKIPDQSTYYARQLYLYNFTIVEGTSKSKLNQTNTFSYVWTEEQYSKNSNLIASAVYHKLTNTTFSPQVEIVRLMADGCSGQNKNTILVGMCQKWFTTAPAQIKKMEIIFPIVGHSYLPSDRVFGRVEKEFRKRDHIIHPREYIELIKEHSTVIQIGEECTVNDWKTAVRKTLKDVSNWHVAFSKCKRFMLIRSKKRENLVLLRGEPHYRIDLSTYRSVCKRNKLSVDIRPNVIMINKKVIKALKLADVNKLLIKHFGSNWRQLDTLDYYDKIIPSGNEPSEIQDEADEGENMCEQQSEIVGLAI